MAVKNNTIITKAYLEGSNDFQQRVPDPTKYGVRSTIDFLMDPYNRQYWNEFVNTLFNKIATSLVHNLKWDNKLAVFKKGKLYFGNTIEEIAVNYLRDEGYTDDSETLLKVRRPEAQVWFHSIDRQAKYAISINEDMLRQAFTGNEEGYGLNSFVAACLNAPRNSDEYDEYLTMKELIAYYENEWGFYKHQLSGAIDDEATAKEMLKSLRALAGKLEFPSSLYNASVIDIPVHATNEDLVFITTPEVMASLDVDALAVLFNVDRADVQMRTVIIDEFPIANAYGLLTTKDFYVAMDALYETCSFSNRDTLTTTYWLHHWSVLSVSPFVPAILFTTDAGTVTKSIKVTPASITVTAASETVKPGDVVQLTVASTGTVNPETEGVIVDATGALFTVTATRTIPGVGDADDTTEAVELNTRTYVDRLGRLHVQKSNLKSGDVLTVNAVSTYVNPSGATTPMTASTTVTIA